jgi:hypothetical protein
MNVSNTVPPTGPDQCRIPWCETDHATALDRAAHRQLIASTGGDRATVEVFHAVRDPEAEPFVQVSYGPDWSAPDRLDIPPAAAVAVADILALLPVQAVAEFAAGLRRAARGPHTPRSTQW